MGAGGKPAYPHIVLGFGIEMNEVSLPNVLAICDEYQSLTAAQAQAFIARLMYVAEISQRIETWCAGELSTSEFLDDLELDVAINLSVSNEPTSHPSTWLVRSSWTFQTSATEMYGALPKSIVGDMNALEPSVECSRREFATWVGRQGEALKVLLVVFSESKSLPEALGSYIALDVFLGKLLVGLCKARLNPNIYV